MSLTHAAFALAGLLAAAGPVVIHLLNRRRFRVVEWGAMAFLRRAATRSRRAVKLRDLLLLILRTAAILLFGLALARPVLTSAGASWPVVALLCGAAAAGLAGLIGVALARRTAPRLGWGLLAAVGLAGVFLLWQTRPGLGVADTAAAGASRQPVHAVLVVDNSRSMSVRSLDGTLLDKAKARAAAIVDQLPPGSRISVLPLCGPERSYTLDAYRFGDDAKAALAKIAPTDRGGNAATMLSLAVEACGRASELPAKRVIFLGDQQATGWPKAGLEEAAAAVPGGVQVVAVSADAVPAGAGAAGAPPNVWIESFEVQDGLAEAGLPANFLATIRYEGDAPADAAEVTLSVGGDAAASQTVDLRPGQSRELIFSVPLDADAQPGRPAFVPASLSVRLADPTADRLERDSVRPLAAPVVAALPVVLIDQHGHDEDLDAGRVGETYRLRRLLAPRSGASAGDPFKPLIAVRHLGEDDVAEAALEDARLVVVAGVARPSAASVKLLRQYVEQGGRLLIAAGGDFDPAGWNAAAWDDGRGVLPAPLAPLPVGVRPSAATAAGQIVPFVLDVASLNHPFFQIEGESPDSLADLYREPFFFQAAAAEVNDETQKQAVEAEAKRIADERAALAASPDAAADLAPAWLLWKTDARAAGGDNPDAGAAPPERLAARTAPRVVGRFSKTGADGLGLPLLVDRRLGYGRVLFWAAGLSSDWDTLAQTNAALVLDRIARTLLEETLPRRGFAAGEPVALPVERRSDVTYTLTAPGGDPTPAPVEATGVGYALRVPDTTTAGIYAVTARRPAAADGPSEPLETTVFAVVGPNEESRLAPLTEDQLAERVPGGHAQWVAPGEEVSLSGGPVRGDRLWKWLAAAVLACLVVEMLLLWRTRRPAPPVQT